MSDCPEVKEQEKSNEMEKRKMRRYKLLPEELAIIRLLLRPKITGGLDSHRENLLKRIGEGDFFMVLYTPNIPSRRQKSKPE